MVWLPGDRQPGLPPIGIDDDQWSASKGKRRKNYSSVKRKVVLNCWITDVLKWRKNVDRCVEQTKENSRLPCQHCWAARPGVHTAPWAHFARLLPLHCPSCRSQIRSRSNNWSSLCRCSFECEVFGTSLAVHTCMEMGAMKRASAGSRDTFIVSSRNIICQMANLVLYVLPHWRCHISIIAYCICEKYGVDAM